MKPMFALHKDGAANVLAAGSFKAEYELQPWLRSLEIRPGDTIEFREMGVRPEDEVEPAAPAFIDERPTPELADADNPF